MTLITQISRPFPYLDLFSCELFINIFRTITLRFTAWFTRRFFNIIRFSRSSFLYQCLKTSEIIIFIITLLTTALKFDELGSIIYYQWHNRAYILIRPTLPPPTHPHQTSFKPHEPMTKLNPVKRPFSYLDLFSYRLIITIFRTLITIRFAAGFTSRFFSIIRRFSRSRFL